MDCFVCSKMVAIGYFIHPKKRKNKNDSVALLRPRVLVTDQKLSDAYDILTLLEAGFVVGLVEGIFGLGIPPWKEANLTVYIICIYIYTYVYVYLKLKET